MLKKNLETTKIKEVIITDLFKQKYSIISVKYEKIQDLISDIENENYISYYVVFKENAYILLEKSNGLSKQFTDNYVVNEVGFNIDKTIILNLLLRSLPKINKNSLFSTTDNLNFLYDFKKYEKDDYKEYYSLDFTIEKNDVLVMKAVTYTGYDGLVNYYRKNNQKELHNLHKKSVFYKNKKLLVKFQHGAENLTKLVRKRINSNKKKSMSAFQFAIDENQNKLEIFSKFKDELKKAKKYFLFVFDKVEVNYIENESEQKENSKTKNKIIVRKENCDFTDEYVLLNNQINIIDTTNSKYLSIVYSLIEKKGVTGITLGEFNENKINLVITYPPEFYKNANNDPFLKYDYFNTQFINVDFLEQEKLISLYDNIKDILKKKEEDKVNKKEKNKEQSENEKQKEKKNKTASLIINKNNTIMLELLVKKNIIDKKINFFKKYSENGLLIKLEYDDHRVINRSGVLNDNLTLTFFEDKDLIPNSELREVEKKLHNLIKNNKTEILLLSFGEKIKGSIFFENIYLLERSSEVLLNDINSVIAKKDMIKNKISSGEIKKNADGKLPKFIGGPSRALTDSNKFDGHGLFGIMHMDRNEKMFQYAIGITENNIQSNVPRFPSFYNVYIITEVGQNARLDFYKFFEHFYIRLNNAVTVPYLKKYLDEYFEYELKIK